MVSTTNLAVTCAADSEAMKNFIQEKESATLAVDKNTNSQNNVTCRNRKDERGSSLRQVTAAFIANLGTINTGMTFGFSAVANPRLIEDQLLRISNNEASWVASLSSVGTPCGCVLSAYLTEILGRKRTLVVTELPAIIGWIMIATAPSVEWIYIGRVLTGVSSGMIGAPSRVYTAEVTQPHLRGILSALASVGASFGVAFEYLLGSIFEWRTLAWISCIIPVLSICTSFLLPESPSWLISSGQKHKCFNSLKKLRGSTCDVQREVNTLVEFSERHKTATNMTVQQKLTAIFHPSILKPFLILTTYFLIYQMSGTNPLTFYSVNIFKLIGQNNDMAYKFTVASGFIRLLFTIVGCILMLQCRRRTLTFVSTIGCGVTMFIFATYVYMIDQWSQTDTAPLLTWIPVLSIFLFTAVSTIGYLIVPWVMIGELYPQKVRGLVGGFTTASCHFFIFIAVKTYPLIRDRLSQYAPFFIYGSISLLGTIFLYVFLPETKDKTLQEIEEYFTGTNKRVRTQLEHEKKPIVINQGKTPSIV